MLSEEAASRKAKQRLQRGGTRSKTRATPPDGNEPRKTRSDAGNIVFTDRDEFALTWIGQQCGIRLDHLQQLLARLPGRGAQNRNWISEGAARDVVNRWKQAKWVQMARIRVNEPFWVWPTCLGLRKVRLPYSYRDLEQMSLDDLKHLYTINEFRLSLEDTEKINSGLVSVKSCRGSFAIQAKNSSIGLTAKCIIGASGKFIGVYRED